MHPPHITAKVHRVNVHNGIILPLKQMERVYTDAAQSSLDAFEHNLESGDTSDPRSNTVNDLGGGVGCDLLPPSFVKITN